MSRYFSRHIMTLVLLLAIALVVPFIVEDRLIRHYFILAFLYAVVASNWDLSLGYAGIFNFGHVAFFGIGVYASAIGALKLGLNPWLAMIFAGFAASLLAALIALPVVRLRGVYVVLVTFAVSQLVLQLILSQAEITGGAQGMVRVPSLRLFDYNFARDNRFGYYYVALGLLCLSTISLRWLVRSPFGLSLRALRDNADYAAARGISAARQHLLVLSFSAFFTGVAGALFTHYLRVASPEIFGFGMMSLVLSMVLVGGISSIYGPIVAALLLTFASEGMAGIEGMANLRFMVISVAMVMVLLMFPGGLASLYARFASRRPDNRKQE